MLNKIFIPCLIFGIILLFCLSNIIFSIEVVHTNKQIRELLLTELDNYGVKRLSIKKSYKQLQRIKENIINKHKDKIEWLEIENVGTKYVVRVEMRIIKRDEEDNNKYNIIAKKDAIIRKVISSRGEILKRNNEYVKKGDVVISGEIKLYDEVKGIVGAVGKVYGEVWYTVTVSFPYHYQEEKYTGNKKKVITIDFLNKNIELTINKYRHKKIEKKTLFKSNIIPIKINVEHQKELDIIDKIYTEDEAISNALDLATKKITEKFKDNEEYIIEHKILKVTSKDNKIVMSVFFSVCENITDYQQIIENNLNQDHL